MFVFCIDIAHFVTECVVSIYVCREHLVRTLVDQCRSTARRRISSSPCDYHFHHFYRAACNADAVLWWEFCLSVRPSVTRVYC